MLESPHISLEGHGGRIISVIIKDATRAVFWQTTFKIRHDYSWAIGPLARLNTISRRGRDEQ